MKANIVRGLTALALASLPIGSHADSSAEADSASLGNALVGPLFYTPLERDAIDRSPTPVASNEESATNGHQPPPAVVRFDGRVERSAGRATAWVSGHPLEQIQPDLPDTRLRLQGERLRIQTPRSTRWLKAGEQFKPDKPELTEPTEPNDTVQSR